MSNVFAQRLREAGFELPPASAPSAGAYVPTVQVGSLLYIAGQISLLGDTLIDGRVGESVDTATARRAAQLCAVNLLAQLSAAVEGDIGRVRRAVRLGVFIHSIPELTEHSSVGDAASELILKVLGPKGAHVRTSVGVASLPLRAAVEADAIFELAS